MALRAGYWGIKKLLSPLKLFKPGELGIDNDALVEDLNSVFFPRSEQAVMGAKNFIRYNAITLTDDGKYELTTTGIRVYNESAHTYSRVTLTGLKIPNNVKMKTTCNCTITSGEAQWVFAGKNAGSSAVNIAFAQITQSGKVTLDIPSTENYESYELTLLCTRGTSELGNVTYSDLMISFEGGEYAPPAMTNKELTQRVAFNNVEITNVNAGITLDNAWSYAYQVGNLVIYALRFTVGASAITENTILCSFGAECSKSMNADILPRQTGNHFLAALTADTTNHRTDFKTFGGATLTASNEFLVSGVYIAKDIMKEAAANRSLPDANRTADPEDVTPEEVPATPSTKKTTKKTASADTNE